MVHVFSFKYFVTVKENEIENIVETKGQNMFHKKNVINRLIH